MLGQLTEIFVDSAIAAILVSICTCFAMIIATKCTDIGEIRRIIATARGIV
jgi:hypothetical protein